jgi:hypothetical protein
MRPRLLSLVMVALLVGCQRLTTPPTPLAEELGEVATFALPGGASLRFPRQPIAAGNQVGASMQGQLVLEGSCLRLEVGARRGFTVIWPAAFTIRVVDNGPIEILNNERQAVGRVGEATTLEGVAAESEQDVRYWESHIAGLPVEGCRAPYWIAGEGTPLASEDPGPASELVHLGVPWADFSLRFDLNQWDRTTFEDDIPGLEALTHRLLTGACRITPNIPVGLGEGWSWEDGQRTLGGLSLQTKRFFERGELRFVAYYGFLGTPFEGGVEVHFEGDAEPCLQAAEALFSTTEIVLHDPDS